MNEFQPAPVVSKEAPEQRVTMRDSLTLDTTAQATPIITPIAGISPASINGYSAVDTSVTASTPDDSFVGVNKISSTTTTTTSIVGDTYKQDVVTVTLKHVEQVEQDVAKAIRDLKETQLPLRTSTPVQEVKEFVKETVTITEKHKNGGSMAPVTESMKAKISPTVESAARTLESTKSATSSPVVQSAPRREVGSNVGRALIKTVLSGLMFTILLIGTIIVIMEIQDPNWRRYLRHVPGEDTFRHQYYEPTRQRAMDWYGGGPVSAQEELEFTE